MWCRCNPVTGGSWTMGAAEGFLQTVYKNQATSQAFYNQAMKTEAGTCEPNLRAKSSCSSPLAAYSTSHNNSMPTIWIIFDFIEIKIFFKLSKYAGDDLLPCVEEVFQALVPTLGHELWVMTERVRWWIHPAEMSFLCLASGVFQSKADAPLLWREPVGGLGIWPGCLLGQVFHVLLGGDVQTHWRDCFSGKAGGGAAAPAAWPWLEKQQMMERCMKLRLWNKIILIVSSSVIEEPCGDPCTEADCLHRRWRTSHSRHFTVTLVTLSFYF